MDETTALDELRLTASMIRRFSSKVTEKQAADIAGKIEAAIGALDSARASRDSGGELTMSAPAAMHIPAPPERARRVSVARSDVSRRASECSSAAAVLPHLPMRSPRSDGRRRPSTTPRGKFSSGAGAQTERRGTDSPRADAMAPPVAPAPTDTAVVKVAARPLVAFDPGATSHHQSTAEQREKQTAVGAAMFVILEGSLGHLQAEGGAIYVPISSEMVSVATILPGLPVFPPALVKHLLAGSVTGSVLSSGVVLHQTGPGLDDNNRRVPSQLLVPIIARDGRRVGVLQIIGKYKGAVKFSEQDEIYATHIADLLADVMTRFDITWNGPQYDPVALHRSSPFVPATMAKDIFDAIPEEMRNHGTAPLVHRIGGTLSLAKRLTLAEDASALGSAPTLREVDCYIENLQECWRRSVQMNINHGQQEQERLSQLRGMRDELRVAKDESKRMSDKLRLEHLDVSDYRAEYTTLKDELDRFLERKRSFDD